LSYLFNEINEFRINVTRRVLVFNCRIIVVNNAIVSLSFPHIVFGFLILVLVNGLPEHLSSNARDYFLRDRPRNNV